MTIKFTEDELELLSSVLKKKVRGWEWAIDEKKIDKQTFEQKVRVAKAIIKKIED